MIFSKESSELKGVRPPNFEGFPLSSLLEVGRRRLRDPLGNPPRCSSEGDSFRAPVSFFFFFFFLNACFFFFCGCFMMCMFFCWWIYALNCASEMSHGVFFPDLAGFLWGYWQLNLHLKHQLNQQRALFHLWATGLISRFPQKPGQWPQGRYTDVETWLR